MNRKKGVGRMRTSALVFALLLGHANSFAVPFFTANATVSVGPKVDNLFFIMWFHLVLKRIWVYAFFLVSTDVNECVTNNGGCQHHCDNTAGSYGCFCDPGYNTSERQCPGR